MLLCTAELSNALWQEAAPTHGCQRGGPWSREIQPVPVQMKETRPGALGMQDGEAPAAQRS